MARRRKRSLFNRIRSSFTPAARRSTPKSFKTFGKSSRTISDVVEEIQTIKQGEEEESLIDVKTGTPPPALPSDLQIAKDEVKKGITKKPIVENPPPPQPEFITEEIKTYTPVYADFGATIVDVINKNTVKIDKDWNLSAQAIANLDGDYEGTDPRARLNFKVQYPHFKVSDLNTYLFGDGDKENLITAIQADLKTIPEFPYSYVLKLLDPIGKDVKKTDEVIVGQKVIPPYTENVVLVPPEEEEEYVVLRSPDVDSLESPVRDRQTSYVTQNTLKTTDSKIRKNFEDTLISASLDSVDLNIDYSVHSNYVNFSSAEARLNNFKYKLGLIETYSAESASMVSVSASLADANKWDRKIREVKRAFTGYEKHLFNESTTYVSGSVIQDTVRYNSAWPKSGGSGTYANPYINYATTSSQAISWYDGQILSASLYDKVNRNSIENLLPRFVQEDSANADFVKFASMMGEFYDNIWLYIKHITKVHDRSEGLEDRNEGFPDELVFDVAKGLGLDLKSNKDLISLERWHLGQYLSGSTYVQYSSKPEKEIQAEIQKRIVNNLPYFLKTKGTIRSIKGVINCFGVPSTILRVREFGGPDVKGKPNFLIKKKFTKALDFRSGQYIKTKWPKDGVTSRRPDTVEFRFAGKNSGSGLNNRYLLEAQDSSSDSFRWAIALRDNGAEDSKGHIDFVLSGSNGFISSSILGFPVYDGDYISVMLSRMSQSGAQLASEDSTQKIRYNLHAKRYDAGRSKIFLTNSASLDIDGTNTVSSSYNTSYHSGSNKLYIGGLANSSGLGYGQYTGSMMEFRLWTSALSESKFDNHVAAPKAYNGNHASSSYTDLVIRYSFDDDKSLQTDPTIRDVSGDIHYVQTGSAVGFTGNFFSSVEDEEKMKVPNLGPNRMMSTKIRIEDSKLVGNLNSKKKMEQSSYDLAPIDSNKVGVYFAPSDVINEDIIRSVADLDFDQYVGDPRDEFRYKYRGLQKVADSYWQKYSSPNNFWDYMRLIKYYDNSIFDLARKFMPARSNQTYGIVIEPNIFERSKEVLGKAPSFENMSFRGEIDLTQYAAENLFSASAEYKIYNGTIGYDSNHSQSFASDMFQNNALYKIEAIDRLGNYGSNYLSSSVTVGGPNYVFSEGVLPFISSSRLSPHNQEYRFFYSSEASQSKGNYYSSSLIQSEYDTKFDQYSNFANLFYEGCKQTINTTPDGFSPVETTDVKQTRLVVQEPGKSRLKTER
jgi:hypothetical protein